MPVTLTDEQARVLMAFHAGVDACAAAGSDWWKSIHAEMRDLYALADPAAALVDALLALEQHSGSIETPRGWTGLRKGHVIDPRAITGFSLPAPGGKVAELRVFMRGSSTPIAVTADQLLPGDASLIALYERLVVLAEVA